jgi:predicted esterase
MRTAALLGLLLAALFAHAQPVEDLITVKRGSYTISGLAMHGEHARPKYGIALFPGYPSIMRIRTAEGELKFDLGGNFLIRSRRHWVDSETLVLSVDAPSDQWPTFYQVFRESPRYGADVAALVEEAGRKYGVEDWTFVGTSEGSVSAFHAARMNPQLAQRLILTSSLFEASRNGPGISRVNFADLRSRLLWVHHADDPCTYTPYRDAQAFAKKSGAPLVTVRGGGGWSGDLCGARTAHGYVGIEVPTVHAMRSWVKTGQVPNDVGP